MTNNLKFQGVLSACSEVKEITSKERKVRVRTLTFTENDDFPQSITGSVFQEKCDENYQVGQQYIVRFNIRAKATDTTAFNAVKFYAIQKLGNFSN